MSARANTNKARRVSGSKKIVHNFLPPFARQLAAMLHAGMPVISALGALEEQASMPSFKMALGNVRKSIEGGAELSESFEIYPSIFNRLFCNIVAGGESSGKLAETLARLAAFLEASEKLRKKVQSAMTYPVVVMCLALGIATAMIIFIVPAFGKMFSELGADLPLMTQFLLDTSDFIRDNGFYILVCIMAAVFSLRWWKKTPGGALAIDRFKLNMPLFGELNKKLAAARFARTFGELTSSGVPILRALEIGAGATGNAVAENILLEARDTVEKGDPLSAALKSQKVLPQLLVRMLEAGEKSGKVEEMAENVADFYDDEIESTLSGLTSLIEPLLMVFLGVVIGGIVASLFLPIFRLASVVAG